jgi:hypothetical protein
MRPGSGRFAGSLAACLGGDPIRGWLASSSAGHHERIAAARRAAWRAAGRPGSQFGLAPAPTGACVKDWLGE